MIRTSLGVYSTSDDVAVLGEALETLIEDADGIASLYSVHMDGTYRLKQTPPPPCTLDIKRRVSVWEQGGEHFAR